MKLYYIFRWNEMVQYWTWFLWSLVRLQHVLDNIGTCCLNCKTQNLRGNNGRRYRMGSDIDSNILSLIELSQEKMSSARSSSTYLLIWLQIQRRAQKSFRSILMTFMVHVFCRKFCLAGSHSMTHLPLIPSQRLSTSINYCWEILPQFKTLYKWYRAHRYCDCAMKKEHKRYAKLAKFGKWSKLAALSKWANPTTDHTSYKGLSFIATDGKKTRKTIRS